METFGSKTKYGLVSNLGVIDRATRYLVGAVLIGSLLLVGAVASAAWPIGWLVMLPLISIPIVISAIVRWDPIYAIFGVSSA